MTVTVKSLMRCGFRIVYGYTESDEISLLFNPEENTFGRKVRKINTTLAGEASATFSMALGTVATFDCRVIPLPNKERVVDYFMWRQEDSHRNSLNTYCYWMLRKDGLNQYEATKELKGRDVSFKNELLFKKGINYNDLPAWQKRGTGIYFRDTVKEGYDPIKRKVVTAKRRELHVDFDIPFGDDYSKFILSLLE